MGYCFKTTGEVKCGFLNERPYLVCEIPRFFEHASPSDFRTQGSFITVFFIFSRKIFERNLSPDSVAKSATQKPWFSETVL